MTINALRHELSDQEADALGYPRGVAIPVKPLTSVDFFKTVEEPISITFPITQHEELQRIFKSSHRRCILIVDKCGPLDDDGSRPLTIRLEPI